MNIKEKFLCELKSFDLDGGVVIAFSGGADSVCLLSLFINAQKDGTFPHAVAAAHLNHCLRGEESDKDERFCQEFCNKNGIPFFSARIDVNLLAKKNGKGIEEAARSARYGFLQDALEKSGCAYIATAHHRGDMCETMLLNLARGTSIDGLCSIPKRRGNIIRPLLSVSRNEILGYVKENNLSFVTDSTNLDQKYSRNRVRLNILPEFEKLFCGYEENLERAARLLRRDADYLSAEADKYYNDVVSDGVLYTKKAQNIHISLLSRITKKLYNYYGYKDMSEAHIEAVCEKIRDGCENFALSMHGCTAVCERGRLTFESDISDAQEFCLSIKVGETVTLPFGTDVTLSKEYTDGAYPLKASALCGRLSLRSRRDGDTIKIFKKTHKIKRIISDKKLSAKEKSKLFFLCSDSEIIYSNIPATSDDAFVRKGESDRIFITVKDTQINE